MKWPDKLKSAYQQLSDAKKTSIYFTICNFLQRGTAFITVPIFTRLLTTQEYGVYSVYQTWFELLVVVTSLKLPYEGLNNGLIRYEEDKDGYVSSIAGLISVMTLGWLVVYLLFRRWIDQFIGLSSLLMGLMFIEIFFNPPLYLWTNRERFDFRYRAPVAVTVASTIVSPVIAIVAVLCTPYKAEARIIATVAVQGVSGAALYVYLLKKGGKFFNATYWKFALRFNLPLIFYYLSQTVLNQADRIMINYYEGTGSTAIYSVAYTAATLTLLLVSAINGSYNPWMYKKLKAGAYGEIRKQSTLICLMLGVVVLLMTAFAPDLVALLATGEYQSAIWVIPPVAASVFFVFLYMLFANVEMYYGETRLIPAVSIISAGANLVLNAIFIPLFGFLAAGWTTLVSYVLLTLLHFLVMKRACRRHSVEENVFAEKRLAVLTVAVIVGCFAMMALYRVGYWRYLVFLLAGLAGIWKRKSLLALLKKGTGEE
ncbi:MAG: oligosaccharide flippase family protein [Clostridiales bacterium]|nr:oligosaccharide flippase family protein [Clostridiales bacterium]